MVLFWKVVQFFQRVLVEQLLVFMEEQFWFCGVSGYMLCVFFEEYVLICVFVIFELLKVDLVGIKYLQYQVVILDYYFYWVEVQSERVVEFSIWDIGIYF